MTTNTLRTTMRQQMDEKELFEQAVKYAFDYLEQVFDRDVAPSPEALHNLTQFDEDIPESTGDPATILKSLHEFGSPATSAQIGGRYFGFVNGSVIPTALGVRWLADMWDQNAALHTTSPIASKMEEICERWLKQFFNLPERTVAGFVTGTSLATFCGLAAGRYRILQNNNWDINKKGLNGAPTIRVITGQQSHATVIKAVAMLGLGTENIEWVACDDQGRIKPSAMPALDQNCLIILQAGNVNSGSFDPFEKICLKATQVNAWVHIDGAFGLWAAASPPLAYLTKGIEMANSWSVDGHKTLNTPYDSGVVLCEDKDALVAAVQASGAYIIHSQHKDGMFYTPEMSRRARAVDMWATLKYLGRAGVDELIYGFHERAVQFAEELSQNGFEVLNDVVFNQVIISCGEDAVTQKTAVFVQQSGECWAGTSKWGDTAVIRISVCSWATTAEDVSRSVRAFVEARAKAQQN